MKLTFLFLILTTLAKSQEFPIGWLGSYSGEMKVSSGKGSSTLPVTLEIREKVEENKLKNVDKKKSKFQQRLEDAMKMAEANKKK